MMATPKWPHDHSAKHSAAAKLGWRRRKHLQNIRSGKVKLPTGAGHHTEKKRRVVEDVWVEESQYGTVREPSIKDDKYKGMSFKERGKAWNRDYKAFLRENEERKKREREAAHQAYLKKKYG